MLQSRVARSYGYALLAIAGWATAASAFKLALRSLDGLRVVAIAAPSSALVLLLVVLGSGKWIQLRQQSRSQLGYSAIQGLLNPCLYYLVLLEAYDRLPAQVAMSLNYTWPLMLAVFAVPILGETLRWRTILAIVISLIGVILLATRGDLSSLHITDPVGVGLALLSTVLWCGYWLMTVRDRRDGVVKLCLGFLFGSFYILVVLPLVSTPWWPSWTDLGLGIYIGIAEMGLAFVFWLQALELAPEQGAIATMAYVSPFLSLGLIAAVLREPIAPVSLLGLGLIMGSILWQSWGTPAAMPEVEPILPQQD